MDIRLDIVGMTCGHCTSTVEHALEKIPGVSKVIVDLDSAGASVTIDNALDTERKVAELCAAVDDVGFDASLSVPSPTNVIILHVTGMTCGHCTATVERALKAISGIADTVVDLDSATATITVGNPTDLTEHPNLASAAVDAVEAVGFDATVADPASQDKASSKTTQPLEVAPSTDAKQQKPPTTSSTSGARPADAPTLMLHVATMHCRSCERWVTDAVSAVPGVSDVAVNLAESSVEMAVAARETQTVADALATAGYTATLWADYLREGASSGNALTSSSDDANGNSSSSRASGAESASPERERAVVLAVGGMTCAACASRVETALAKVPGVADAMVNFLTGRVVVRLALPSSQPSATPPSPSRASSPRLSSPTSAASSPLSPSTTWRTSAMESGLLEPISPEAGAPSKSYQSIVADPSPITPLPTATELADVVVDVGYTAVAVSGGGGSGAGGAGGAGGGDGSSSATSCALEVQDLVCDACPARVVKALQAMYGTTSCTIDLLGKGSAPSSSSSSSSHGSSGVSGEWREAGRAVVHLIWDSEVPHCGARSAIAILAVLGYPASLAEAAPDGMCVCVTAG